MKRELSFFGDAVSDAAFEFGPERQHRMKHLTQRGEIIVGHPLPQREKLPIEHRGCVEYAQYVLELNFWQPLMNLGHNARKTTLAERNQNAPAHHRLHSRWNAVSENGVQGHRDGNIAEFRH